MAGSSPAMTNLRVSSQKIELPLTHSRIAMPITVRLRHRAPEP
jgi:hypothetical protein